MRRSIETNTKVNERIRVGDKVTLARRGKRGIWCAEFWHRGQHRHRSMKTTNLKIARQCAVQLEIDIAEGQYRGAMKSVSINEAIKHYMTSKEGEAKSAKTIVKYRFELEAFRDFLAEKRATLLEHITPHLFEQYRVQRMKKSATKTVYAGLVILKGWVKWTVLRRMLRENPLVTCTVTKPYAGPKTAPTAEQVNQILNTAVGDRKIQYAVGAFSGIRAGELRMLRPEDVDLEGGWIHIVGRPGWMPKTRQARKIPIHPRLAPLLATVSKGNRPYIFCELSSRSGAECIRPINLRTLNSDFQALAKSLGVKVGRKNNGLVYHSLRHFFETVTINARVPRMVVDAWQGHVGEDSTAKKYYDLTDAMSQEFMKSVPF